MYEIHVTLLKPGCSAAGWTDSRIAGDPDLGSGLHYYKTAHAATEKEAKDMVAVAKTIWPDAIRYKIETTILDERTELKPQIRVRNLSEFSVAVGHYQLAQAETRDVEPWMLQGFEKARIYLNGRLVTLLVKAGIVLEII